MKCTAGSTVVVYIPRAKTNSQRVTRARAPAPVNFFRFFVPQPAVAMRVEGGSSLARLAEVPVGCDRL